MPLDTLKTPLLDLYYLATLPQRRQAAAARQEDCRVPIISLFYHRISDEHPNDWTLSNEMFRRQIDWLRERFDIVSLEVAQRRISSESNHRPTVCITFDDGYADNCESALPWLIDQNLPFTYFVTSSNMVNGEPFPHDVNAGRPLSPNTVDQIRELAEAGVEIGAHSRTHADLGLITDEETLFDEIVGSKRELESIINQPVRYFAFPFGLPDNLSTEGFRIAFESGLWGVCSAYGGYNLPGEDSFHLQRIHGDPEWSRFRNWLTVDPRKLNRQRQFLPGDYRDRF
ncbi:MAG: polysaccharide deacetylase family protein [Planctomycetota bacterium]